MANILSRSIEEVFAMFIAASMIVYAFKDVVHGWSQIDNINRQQQHSSNNNNYNNV